MSDTKELSFLEHLDVLRGVLFKIIGIFSVLCVPAWFCAPYVMKRLLAYAAPAGFKLHYFSLMEPFFIQLKVMLTLAVFASLPFTAYYLWEFIAPGLTELERKRIRPPLFLSFFLAVAGAVFAILLIVPIIVRFSLSFQTEGMEPVIGIESFVSMMLLSALACAALFQFPVLLLILLSLGIVDLAWIRKQRAVVLVVILIIAAIVTPPDVVSQLMVAVPTYLLFEGSLLLFRFYRKPDDSMDVYEEESKKES